MERTPQVATKYEGSNRSTSKLCSWQQLFQVRRDLWESDLQHIQCFSLKVLPSDWACLFFMYSRLVLPLNISRQPLLSFIPEASLRCCLGSLGGSGIHIKLGSLTSTVGAAVGTYLQGQHQTQGEHNCEGENERMSVTLLYVRVNYISSSISKL